MFVNDTNALLTPSGVRLEALGDRERRQIHCLWRPAVMPQYRDKAALVINNPAETHDHHTKPTHTHPQTKETSASLLARWYIEPTTPTPLPTQTLTTMSRMPGPLGLANARAIVRTSQRIDSHAPDAANSRGVPQCGATCACACRHDRPQTVAPGKHTITQCRRHGPTSRPRTFGTTNMKTDVFWRKYLNKH